MGKSHIQPVKIDMQLLNALNHYLERYFNKLKESNAKQATEEFNEQWMKLSFLNVDNTKDNQSKYANALITLSEAIYFRNDSTKKDIERLTEIIHKYTTNCKYNYGIKQTLFYKLGMCWHKIGKEYDDLALCAFKKYVLYLLLRANNSVYQPTAFAFKKCSTYLYQSLINDELNMSSPTTFNDPFDCPIIELLNQDKEIGAIISKAYKECLKVACFVTSESKGYLNEIMWAHYADSHSGICIKYHLNNIHLCEEHQGRVAFFTNVKYSNEELRKYSNMDTITLKDAFFLKGKSWEYENEIRLVNYNINNRCNFSSIPIQNCIEAIYFGLRCSSKDKATIFNIMKKKKYKQNEKDTGKPVQFFEIIKDDNLFGQLKIIPYQAKQS